MKYYIIYLLLLAVTVSKVDLYLISKPNICLSSHQNKYTNNDYISSFSFRLKNNKDDDFIQDKKYDDNANITQHKKYEEIYEDDVDIEYTYANTLWVILLLFNMIMR